MKILIKNGLIVNENQIFESDILVNGELIEKIDKGYYLSLKQHLLLPNQLDK